MQESPKTSDKSNFGIPRSDVTEYNDKVSMLEVKFEEEEEEEEVPSFVDEHADEDFKYDSELSASDVETEEEAVVEEEEKGDGDASDDDDFSPGGSKRGYAQQPIQCSKRRKTGNSSRVTSKRRSKLENLPKVPRNDLPLNDLTNASEYELARHNLHVSWVPDLLPCREEEYYCILGLLESMLSQGGGGCLYISGVPGTGKTATIMEVLRVLQAKIVQGEICAFHLTSVNGMKVTDPAQAYSLFYESLSGKRVTPSHALELLKKKFENPKPTDDLEVLLIDELDLLLNKKQDLLYNFFDWANRPNSKLIVIAIANTMDLPERMLSLRVASRLGINRVGFQPYASAQLEEILRKRLQGTNVFDDNAIKFVSTKVANVTGDARRVLDIARRAVEIAEQKYHTARASSCSLVPLTKVTTQIVSETVTQMYSSHIITFLKRSSKYQKLFMYVVTSLIRKSGIGEIEFCQISHSFYYHCRLYNFDPPTHTELSYLATYLSNCRCILLENGAREKGIYAKVKLNVSESDVIVAIKSDDLLKRLVVGDNI